MASSLEPAVRDHESDWAAQAADTVDRFVVGISDRTAGPLTTVARAIKFGLLTAFLATAAVVLFIVASVRVLDIWFKVWAIYAALGGIFTIAGLFLWSKGNKRPD